MKTIAGSRVDGPRRVLACTLMLSALGLAGCSSHETSETQIAARVNDGEVSIHQVEHVLRQQPRWAAEHGEKAARLALDNLVEQELAAQAARDAGLDRDPAVIQSLEAARREALARAFQDRLADQAIQPDTDTIDRYYDEHPERFANRRLYSLQEFSIEATPRQREAVRALAQTAANVSELQQGLVSLKLRYSTRPLMLATEAIPTQFRSQLQELQVGRALMFERPRGVQILYLAAAQQHALDRSVARPIIEAELLAERRRERVELGMKPVREAARVDHLGKFAAAASPSPAASSP